MVRWPIHSPQRGKALRNEVHLKTSHTWGSLGCFLAEGWPSLHGATSVCWESLCSCSLVCTQSWNAGLPVCLLGVDTSSFERAVVHLESVLWSKRNPAEAMALAPDAWKMLYLTAAAGNGTAQVQAWRYSHEQWWSCGSRGVVSPTTPEQGKRGGPEDCGQVQPRVQITRQVPGQVWSLSAGPGQHQDQALWPRLDTAPGWLGRAMGMGQAWTSAHGSSVLVRHRLDTMPNQLWVNQLFSSVAPTHPVTQHACHKPHSVLPWTPDSGTLSYKRTKRSCSPPRGSWSLIWKLIYLFTVHRNRAIRLLSTYCEQVAKSSSLRRTGQDKYRDKDTYMHTDMFGDIDV